MNQCATDSFTPLVHLCLMTVISSFPQRFSFLIHLTYSSARSTIRYPSSFSSFCLHFFLTSPFFACRNFCNSYFIEYKYIKNNSMFFLLQMLIFFSIYPSIFQTILSSLESRGLLEPIIYNPIDILETTIDLSSKFLDLKTHACTGRTHKLHIERFPLGYEPGSSCCKVRVLTMCSPTFIFFSSFITLAMWLLP